ncbi:MAG: hypothetical protein V7750_18230 [Sneathiella sp.]
MSKSRFIISVRSKSTADKQTILSNFLRDPTISSVEFLSDPNTAQTSDWFVALMDDQTHLELSRKYNGQLIIEPDSDLMY